MEQDYFSSKGSEFVVEGTLSRAQLHDEESNPLIKFIYRNAKI
jgi:hypothetical protein